MYDRLFSLNGFDITGIQIVLCLSILVIASYLFFKFRSIFLKLEGDSLSASNNIAYQKRLGAALFMLVIFLSRRIINFDMTLINVGDFEITIGQITEILALTSFAMLLDWILRHIIIENRYKKREITLKRKYNVGNKDSQNASKLVRYIIVLYFGRILLHRFDLDLILFQKVIKNDLFTIQLSDVIVVALILLVARLIVWFIIQISLYRMYLRNDMDSGTQYAINQIVTYIIYVLAIIFALDRVLSDMSLIYGGAAALLVGIGLGLQQIFNDFFSGLILLFERTVMVGDIVELDGHISRVTKIGLRASRVETRDHMSQVVPNSKLVNATILNLTHNDNVVRFDVSVSVAYGTDMEKVKNLLLQCARENKFVLEVPEPFVRFLDFGDSGLHVGLYFFSNEVMWAEEVKSQLRFHINSSFIENGIKIPFPQRDVHLYKTESQ
jgi:small-conductance mechanosensitive channel